MRFGRFGCGLIAGINVFSNFRLDDAQWTSRDWSPCKFFTL
jgi:hypothetical protein